jgi:O-methyltransferase
MGITHQFRYYAFNSLQRLLKSLGYDMVQTRTKNYPEGFSDAEVDILNYEHFDIIRQASPYSTTGPARLFSLIESVKYVVNSNIRGHIVECGVWKGGSMMAAALALLKMNTTDRSLFLYDTYKGMTPPSEEDVSTYGENASNVYLCGSKIRTKNSAHVWCDCPLEQVKKNLLNLGYPNDKIFFIEGKVEETIPLHMPSEISILRLDTDFYESTKHELEHLFPRLSPGGVLIIDDYGHWLGQKKAVDEYFQKHEIRILLNRIDYACRVGIKRGDQ